MLPRDQRLTRSAEFTAAVRGGRRCGRTTVVVHLLASGTNPASEDVVPGGGALAGSAGPTRAGFVVGRSVGGAVVRNTVARRLRALVRERLPRLPAGSSLVVRALPAAATASSPALAADLDRCLDRLVGAGPTPVAGR